MDTLTTALTLDSIEPGTEIVVPRRERRALFRKEAAGLLQRSAEVTAVIAAAPLALAVVWTLLLVFIVRLLVAFVAVGFES